jgi:hypothetical protein
MTRLCILVLLFALASPALAGTPSRCTTYEEPTLNHWQTLCDDGTRAVSTWEPDAAAEADHDTASPSLACTGQLNPSGKCKQDKPLAASTSGPGQGIVSRVEGRDSERRDADDAGGAPWTNNSAMISYWPAP